MTLFHSAKSKESRSDSISAKRDRPKESRQFHFVKNDCILSKVACELEQVEKKKKTEKKEEWSEGQVDFMDYGYILLLPTALRTSRLWL